MVVRARLVLRGMQRPYLPSSSLQGKNKIAKKLAYFALGPNRTDFSTLPPVGGYGRKKDQVEQERTGKKAWFSRG